MSSTLVRLAASSMVVGALFGCGKDGDDEKRREPPEPRALPIRPTEPRGAPTERAGLPTRKAYVVDLDRLGYVVARIRRGEEVSAQDVRRTLMDLTVLWSRLPREARARGYRAFAEASLAKQSVWRDEPDPNREVRFAGVHKSSSAASADGTGRVARDPAPAEVEESDRELVAAQATAAMGNSIDRAALEEAEPTAPDTGVPVATKGAGWAAAGTEVVEALLPAAGEILGDYAKRKLCRVDRDFCAKLNPADLVKLSGCVELIAHHYRSCIRDSCVHVGQGARRGVDYECCDETKRCCDESRARGIAACKAAISNAAYLPSPGSCPHSDTASADRRCDWKSVVLRKLLGH